MRKVMLCCALMLAQTGFLLAEPLVLEQAGNVLKPKKLEIGLADIAYQTDETKITDTAGTVVMKLTNSATVTPLYARYAFTPAIEGLLKLPYSSVSSKTEITGGAATSASDSGLADPTLSGKYSFAAKGWDLAAAAAITIPMGKESTTLPSSFKQGMNIKPLLAARKEFGKVTMNANLSYKMTGEYTDENKIKQNPCEIISVGVGAEYPCRMVSGITCIGEFVYNSFSDAAVAGVTQAGSSGSQMDLLLGGRYDKGNIKTKLGLDLSLGDEKYRAYDYKIVAGVTYLVKI
jgi:hypothetical protein